MKLTKIPYSLNKFVFSPMEYYINPNIIDIIGFATVRQIMTEVPANLSS